MVNLRSVTTVKGEKWTLNELISYCVQEEKRLKQDRTESAHLASTSKDKGKRSVRSDRGGEYYGRYDGLGEQLIF